MDPAGPPPTTMTSKSVMLYLLFFLIGGKHIYGTHPDTDITVYAGVMYD
jgi:hypothetical protein